MGKEEEEGTAPGFGGMPNFLPSLKAFWGLRDKREQLSDSGLVRTGVCLQPIQLRGRARPRWGGTDAAGILPVGTVAASDERVLP